MYVELYLVTVIIAIGPALMLLHERTYSMARPRSNCPAQPIVIALAEFCIQCLILISFARVIICYQSLLQCYLDTH